MAFNVFEMMCGWYNDHMAFTLLIFFLICTLWVVCINRLGTIFDANVKYQLSLYINGGLCAIKVDALVNQYHEESITHATRFDSLIVAR